MMNVTVTINGSRKQVYTNITAIEDNRDIHGGITLRTGRITTKDNEILDNERSIQLDYVEKMFVELDLISEFIG